MRSRIGELVAANDWDAIADVVSKRFGVDVEGRMVRDWLKAPAREMGDGKGHWAQWSDCSWLCFIKNRIVSRRMYRPGCEHRAEYTTTVLHVFFPCIEETPAMLSRLEEKNCNQILEIARSKISKTALETITPINATTLDVVGNEWRQQQNRKK